MGLSERDKLLVFSSVVDRGYMLGWLLTGSSGRVLCSCQTQLWETEQNMMSACATTLSIGYLDQASAAFGIELKTPFFPLFILAWENRDNFW